MKCWIGVLAALTLGGCASASTDVALSSATQVSPAQPENEWNFIRREGAQLFDGDEEFRFLSVNIPTLWLVEDDWTFATPNTHRLATEFEIRDVLASARELGGHVVRAYTIPVRNESYPEEAVTFVEAPGVFNETAFQTMDLAIAVARENGIRLIIPLVNNWEWHGGRPNYAAFRGKDTDAFCTDPQIRDDFKATIAFVLNRVNTVTGIRYNDDPTIMAWETGNEMTCPGEWAVDIARTIKSHAPRQLVVDGWHAVHMPYNGKILRDFPRQHSIDESSIDLVSTHHYEEDPAAMIRNMRETVERIGGKKAVFPGEFGFMSAPALEKVYDYIISEPDIPGGMIWSLRRHHEKGGWLHHTEPLGNGLYRAYHWPGFDDGEPFGERDVLSGLRRKAYEIRGLDVPARTAPPAPRVLPIGAGLAINWQGSVGAASYDIERAQASDGPWQTITHAIDDIATPGFDLYNDTTAKIGEEYFYRIIARNRAGLSEPSNVVGPVVADHLTMVDEARGFGVVARWQGIDIKSGDYVAFKEAFSRFSGVQGSELVYTAPGSIKELRVYSYERGADPALGLSVGDVEEDWQIGDVTISAYEEHQGYTPRLYSLKGEGGVPFDFVRLAFTGTADIVRVEIDYVD